MQIPGTAKTGNRIKGERYHKKQLNKYKMQDIHKGYLLEVQTLQGINGKESLEKSKMIKRN